MNQLHDEDARREYWISYMEEMNGLVERCLVHPVEENGEPMRSIPDAFAAAGVETMFSDSLIDNRLERIYFIRENLMDQLVQNHIGKQEHKSRRRDCHSSMSQTSQAD